MSGIRLSDDESARITWLGAAREVTGSRTLVETARTRFLIDCGLLQGRSETSRRNADPFPADYSELDAVVLTHAHIDHSGLLPRLTRDRFSGPVLATRGTADLCDLMLRDSAHIQEQDTQRSNRRRQRRGDPPREPLYGIADAAACLEQFRPQPFHQWVSIGEDVQLRFWPVGHILGAASLEVLLPGDRRVVFSGDIGRSGDPLLPDPEVPDQADLVVMESTYGDRNHRDLEGTLLEFEEIIHRARADRDNVLIPVFTVGRAQEVLYYLHQLLRRGKLEPGQIYLDSPMAISATAIYRRHLELLRPEIRQEFESDLDPLGELGVHYCRTATESMALNESRGAIILAGSGMCDAGRMRHHLKHHLWRKSTQLVIVGFQAQGTLGRILVDGASSVKLFGDEVKVEAAIHTLGGFSAHADQHGLLEWLAHFGSSRPEVVLVHGEEAKMEILTDVLRQRMGWAAWAPKRGDLRMIPRQGPLPRPG